MLQDYFLNYPVIFFGICSNIHKSREKKGSSSTLNNFNGNQNRAEWVLSWLKKVKNPHAMQENWVRSLVWEDPLKEGMATTPVFLPGKSHGQRNLVVYSP